MVVEARSLQFYRPHPVDWVSKFRQIQLGQCPKMTVFPLTTLTFSWSEQAETNDTRQP